MSYVLFTDSDCDMTPQIAKEYGYKTIISMPYSIDGKTTYPYVDFDQFDVHAFYQQLRDGVLPNTSAISAQQYYDYFEKEFAKGNDILYVHFSAAMTMTFNNMSEAIQELRKKYPERKLYQVDTKGITTICLAIAMDIGRMYQAGKTAEEIVKWAETEVDHYAMYFFADDLKFFKHSGRVSGLTATMGSIIGISNMKSGNMFGRLKKYLKREYLFRHRIVTFDSMYEDGQYAVFAAAEISVVPGTALYYDLWSLNTKDRDEREQAIRRLTRLSSCDSLLDVRADEQILVLVTCIDQDTNRLVVAARRLREGETENRLDFRKE